VRREAVMLDLLKEAGPGIGRVACPCRQDHRDNSWAQIVDAARGLGVEIVDIAAQGPDDFDHFFRRHAVWAPTPCSCIMLPGSGVTWRD
jgi:hypothetical protein